MVRGARVCCAVAGAIVVLLLGVRALAVGEFADIYLYDGRHFFGKILEESEHKLVLEYHHGEIVVDMTFAARDIERIERQARAAPDPALEDPVPEEDGEEDAWRPEPADGPGEGGWAIVPVRGTFGQEITAGFFEDALAAAERDDAEAVIFHLDSPGGMVGELERVRAELDRQESRGYQIAFYVDQRAFSAAAMLCMSSEHFYLGPGARLGAAVAFRIGQSGSAEVDAKFNAAFAATWRSRAEAAGRHPALVDAMVEMDSVLWADTRTEPWTLFAEEPEWEEEGESPYVEIDHEKSVLALTHTEALNVGAADGEARSAREVVRRLDLRAPEREAFDGERFSERYFRTWRNNMERARRAVRDAKETASMLGTAENRVELKNDLRSVMANFNRVIRLYERHDYVRNYIDSEGYSVRSFEEAVRLIRRYLGRE